MTRKILSLVLSIMALSCMTAKAENEEQPKYAHFIDTDKVWEYGYGIGVLSIDDYTLYSYKIEGTEEHYGKTYHVLWETRQVSWERKWDGEPAEVTTEDTLRKIALLREDNDKVYMLYQPDRPVLFKHKDIYNPLWECEYIPDYDTDSPEPLQLFIPVSDYPFDAFTENAALQEGDEITIYDFGTGPDMQIDIWGFTGFELITGDTQGNETGWIHAYTPGIFRYDVKETDEEILNSQDSDLIIRKVRSKFPTGLAIKTTYEYNSYAGATDRYDACILGPVVVTNGYTDQNERDFWFNNLYDKEGNVLYAGKNVQPPAHDGVAEIGAEAAARDMRMFDLMGREISNPLPGTVYIQNGRKLIAR